MKKILFLSLLLPAFALVASDNIKYPQSKRGDVVEKLHGTKVADPYRWLEDLDGADTKKWVDSQNEVTFGYLESLKDRKAIYNRLEEVWNYERVSPPSKREGKYFTTRNSGLQNQSLIYMQDSLDDEPRLVMDPNKLSADGTVAVMGWDISPDARYFAYSISRGGSDWREIYVRDLKTGKDLPDHIKWVKFSGFAWSKDSKGFYYGRYPAPEDGQLLEAVNTNQKVFYHTIGQTQDQNELIYERPDQPNWGFGAGVTEDGRYLMMSAWNGTAEENAVFIKDLKKGGDFMPVLDKWDASYSYMGNIGSTFYFRTNKDASRYRVFSMDVNNPDPSNWKSIIPENKYTMRGASLTAGGIAVSWMADALTKVTYHDTNGKLIRDIKMPGPGTAGGFLTRFDENEVFYTFTSYTTPGDIYRYDYKTDKHELYQKSKIKLDTSGFTSKQVFYTSKDGTRVPMIISHKKGLDLNGQNPTMLYGYGGFNISLTPSFSIERAIWMEMGGVVAVPNLRGGGEYGKEWHQAGTKERKQNVFDDFIAAAEYLIAQKYTSSDHLAIMGGSNGGLLVGACMTQRPDLFAVALPLVGVLDMLRFHKFTIGWAWTSDYGSADNPEDFKYLMAYSPLHNLKPGTEYPATLIMTSDRDDRVVPSHSFKFAAELQHNHKGANPVLIRVETDAGHGAGTATNKRIEGAADRIAFSLANMGKKKTTGF